MGTATLPKLEIGAGETPKREGWINADFHPGPNIHAVFDACGPWPFDDNSIGFVQANHVLEHLPDPAAFMREAYRVLAPSYMATLYIRVPYGPSESGFGDITHIRYFTSTSFACFQKGYGSVMRNRQYSADAEAGFEVVVIYQRVHPNLRKLMRPGIRRLTLKALPFMFGGYCELVAGLRPLKRGEVVEKPGTVPVRNVMYEHEYKGRPLQPGEIGEWKFFD